MNEFPKIGNIHYDDNDDDEDVDNNDKVFSNLSCDELVVILVRYRE